MVDVPGTLLGVAAIVTAAGTLIKQIKTHADVKRTRAEVEINKDAAQRIEHEVRDQGVRTAELEGQMAQAFKLLVEGQTAGREVGQAMLDYFRGHDKP